MEHEFERQDDQEPINPPGANGEQPRPIEGSADRQEQNDHAGNPDPDKGAADAGAEGAGGGNAFARKEPPQQNKEKQKNPDETSTESTKKQFEERYVTLEPLRIGVSDEIYPDTANLQPYQWLHDYITKKKEIGRKLKVIMLIGPGSAGKTFMLFRLAKLMANSHVLRKRDGDGALDLDYDAVSRSIAICAYRFDSTREQSGGTDYLIIDCPGERYNKLIDFAGESKINRTNTETPADVLAAAACLYWTDAIALALPAMHVLDSKNYINNGDSLVFSREARDGNVKKCNELVRNLMLLRQCMQEIKAWRREANGQHTNSDAVLNARMANYRVDEKAAAGLSDIPIKLMFTMADEMLAFSDFSDNCDANPVSLAMNKGEFGELLTATLADQYTFASWDFITAFNMPNKQTMRADQTANPQALPYNTTDCYGMDDLLKRWLNTHTPEPLLIRPADTDTRLGKLQWHCRRIWANLPAVKRDIERLFGAPWHVASKDLLPLALADKD